MMVNRLAGSSVKRKADCSVGKTEPSTDSLTAAYWAAHWVSWKALQTAGNSVKTWGSLREVSWEYQMVAKSAARRERPRAGKRAAQTDAYLVHWSAEW